MFQINLVPSEELHQCPSCPREFVPILQKLRSSKGNMSQSLLEAIFPTDILDYSGIDFKESSVLFQPNSTPMFPTLSKNPFEWTPGPEGADPFMMNPPLMNPNFSSSTFDQSGYRVTDEVGYEDNSKIDLAKISTVPLTQQTDPKPKDVHPNVKNPQERPQEHQNLVASVNNLILKQSGKTYAKNPVDQTKNVGFAPDCKNRPTSTADNFVSSTQFSIRQPSLSYNFPAPSNAYPYSTHPNVTPHPGSVLPPQIPANQNYSHNIPAAQTNTMYSIQPKTTTSQSVSSAGLLQTPANPAYACSTPAPHTNMYPFTPIPNPALSVQNSVNDIWVIAEGCDYPVKVRQVIQNNNVNPVQNLTFPNIMPQNQNVAQSNVISTVPPPLTVRISDDQMPPSSSSPHNPNNSRNNKSGYSQATDNRHWVYSASRSMKFDGSGNWNSFKSQFIRYVTEVELNPQEQLSCLVNCLRGIALDVFSANPANLALTFDDLMQRLESVFGDPDTGQLARVNFEQARQKEGESLQLWSQRLYQMGVKAFPTFGGCEMESKIIEHFCMRSLHQLHGSSVFFNENPKSMLEAQRFIQRRLTTSMVHKSEQKTTRVRLLLPADDSDHSDSEVPLRQIQKAPQSPSYQPRPVLSTVQSEPKCDFNNQATPLQSVNLNSAPTPLSTNPGQSTNYISQDIVERLRRLETGFFQERGRSRDRNNQNNQNYGRENNQNYPSPAYSYQNPQPNFNNRPPDSQSAPQRDQYNNRPQSPYRYPSPRPNARPQSPSNRQSGQFQSRPQSQSPYRRSFNNSGGLNNSGNSPGYSRNRSPAPQSSNRGDGCFRCGVLGHYARDCQAVLN